MTVIHQKPTAYGALINEGEFHSISIGVFVVSDNMSAMQLPPVVDDRRSWLFASPDSPSGYEETLSSFCI